MIEIGRLPNARAAQALVDYLKGKQIQCQIVPAEKGVIIAVEQQDADIATREFLAFVQNPYADKYRQASWDNGNSGTKIDYGAPSLQLFSQFITGAGPLTLIVMFACIAVYIGLHFGFTETVFNGLSYFGASSTINYGEAWRVFTPSLLHFSPLHIIFNLIWWWYLGGKIENRIGLAPLAILLIVAGTLPNVVQYWLAGPNFGGLSGVVYALVGYTWVMGNRKPEAGVGLPNAYIGFMLLWLVLGFVDILGPSMANGAHVAGLAVGLAQGWLDSRRR